MRCKGCNYSLWKTKAGPCPECGLLFKPTDMVFTQNAVAFMCPHCGQDYYGTSKDGHLEPRTFDCVKCAKLIDEDQMLLRPTTGVAEELAIAPTMPWVYKPTAEDGFSKRSSIVRWFRTMWWSMFAPHKLADGIRDGTLGRAVGFALITTVICGGAVFLPFALLMLGIGVGQGGARGATLGAMGTAAAGTGTMLIMIPLIMILLSVPWFLLTNLVLALMPKRSTSTGPGLYLPWGPRYGLGRTFEAGCYSMGWASLLLVPCLNFYMIPVVPLGMCISFVVILRQRQEIATGSAILAVLLSMATILLGIGTLVGLLVWLNA
jgi:hypothetical protein